MGFLDNLSELGGEALGEGKLIVGVDSARLKKGMDQIGETVQTKASGWGAAFKVAQVGIVALTTAFVGFAVEGVKKADELDAAVGRISAQVSLTTAESAHLRQGLLEMSTRTKQPVDELAKSIENIAKAGYSVDDALKVQEASARVATVTNADLGTVTNTVVTAMKAWNIEAKDVSTVTDTLITTVGQSRIDFDALSRIIATAAPIAKDAGVSFNDLNAAIIAVGRSGIPARRASAGVIALIRSLSSDTAQKEMKLLGLTVNATTIAHDGLLATLQKIDAASGGHVSVLVKTKGAEEALTKAGERLHVAQLRLAEVERKSGSSAATVAAARNRVADATRAYAKAQAAAASGGIDYTKSAEATAKANKGQLQAMQAMVGGASGLVTADILLANGAKDYKDGQDALNKSLGKTNEEFEKVKEADLSIQLALIRNQITKLAIDLGTQFLPYVARALSWLSETLPSALRGIGDLWNNVLKAPVMAMLNSFLQMASAIAGLFSGLVGTGSSGGPVAGFFRTLAGLVATIARDIGMVFDVVKNLINLPGGGLLIQFVAFAGSVRLVASLIPALAKVLTAKALGALNFLTGGVFKLTGPGSGGAVSAADQKTIEAATKTSEAAAKTGEAAAKLTEASGESATKLGESATKLSEAAAKIAEGSEKALFSGEAGAAAAGESFNAAEAIRNQTYVESTIENNELGIEAARATKAADKTTIEANDSTVQTNTQQQVVQQEQKVLIDDTLATNTISKRSLEDMALAVKAGQEAALGAVEEGEAARTAIVRESALKQGLGASFGAGEAAVASGGGRISGALGSVGGALGGLVSKAIVPLLIAQLAGDILKAPIGDFIAQNTTFKQVGAEIKENFFGGMIDLARSVFAGTDSWVGHAAETVIGDAHISTMELAKLGITSAEIGDLQSLDPKVAVPAQLDAMAKMRTGLSRQVGETTQEWFTRLQSILGETTSDAISQTINDKNLTPGTAAYDTTVGTLLSSALDKYISDQFLGIGRQFDSLVGGILSDRGFTAGEASQLTPETQSLITKLANAGTDKYGFLLDFVAKKALGQVGEKLDASANKSAAGLLGPENVGGVNQSVVLARGTEVLRQNVIEAEKQFSDALDALPQGQGEAIRHAMAEMADQIGNVDPGIAQALAKKFGAHWAEAMRTGTETFAAAPDKEESKKLSAALGRNWKSILLSIGEGTASEATIATTKAKLKAAFGKNWKDVFAGAVSGTTDQATVKEMVRLFGPDWRGALSQFGTLLWQSEGGKDHDILVNQFKAYAASLVNQLSNADLMPKLPLKPGPQPMPKPLIPGPQDVSGKRNTMTYPVEPKLSPADEKKARDAVNAAVGAAIKDGTLEMAASPDVAVSKDAIAKLGVAWTKAIPDAAARDNFITEMVAWQKLNQTTMNQNLFGVLPTLPGQLNSVSTAFDGVSASAGRLLNSMDARPGNGGTGGSSTTPSQSGRPGGRTQTATGGIFDVNSVTHAPVGDMDVTMGEAGNEEVAVVSHPRSFSWAMLSGMGGAQSPRMPGQMSRGSDGGGRSLTLQIDTMHVQSKPDEQAILDTLEFMAPGGIA